MQNFGEKSLIFWRNFLYQIGTKLLNEYICHRLLFFLLTMELSFLLDADALMHKSKVIQHQTKFTQSECRHLTQAPPSSSASASSDLTATKWWRPRVV